MDLIELYDQYREDPAFEHLRTPSIKLVPGRGAPRPRVLIVGQNPGAQENLQGKPFVGRAGQLLSQLMELAGLSADDEMWTPTDIDQGEPEVSQYANTFITNAVKYKTPNNRAPDEREIKASRPYLRREWRILGGPPVIVVTGTVALRALLPEETSIGRVAGQMIPLRQKPTPVFVAAMYHPMFGIYTPSNRPILERHWEELGKWIRKQGVL